MFNLSTAKHSPHHIRSLTSSQYFVFEIFRTKTNRAPVSCVAHVDSMRNIVPSGCF